MYRDKKGFTLIEMLIVMLIIALLAGLVAPVAYKSVDKFKSYQNRLETNNAEKMKVFLSFITSSQCKIYKTKKTIVCKNLKYSF